jgi:hypothetical protein
MFKRNYIYTALVAASAVFVSSAAVAQESVTGDATVTVSNAFTLQQDVAIDFGTLRIFNDEDTNTTGVVTVTIPGNTNPMSLAALAPTEASGTIIAAGAPGEFSISAAAPFTALTIDFSDATAVALTNTGAPSTTPEFTVAFAATTTYIVGGSNDGQLLVPATDDLVTDGTGAVGFRLGGVLTTDDGADAGETYADGVYAGTFSLTVDY